MLMLMNHFPTLRNFPLLLAAAALPLNFGYSPEKPTLRVGINPWPGYEFLYLAQEKGFYREEGLEVRLVEFNSLSDARRAYERGQINVLTATVIEVLQVRDNSPRSPQIVQVVDYSNGADVILARPGLTNGASLRGARIGLELASLGVYVLARGLERSGLSLADVEMVSVDQLAMEDGYHKGELDAVVTYPPISTKLLRDTQATAVFSSAEIPGEVIDVIAVEAEVNTQRPGDVAKLLRAYHRAIAYTRQHPVDAYRIMAAREGLTPEEFRAALTGGIRLLSESDQAAYLRPGGKLAAVIGHSDRVLRQSGQIKGPDRRGNVFTSAFAGKEPSQ
jgi:NitT/TauT family transport system substrate-binding protein